MLARVFKGEQIDKWIDSAQKDSIAMADALMALSVNDNELSFWDVEVEELGQAALAWNSSRDKVTGVFVAYLDPNEIEKKIDTNNEPGNTVIEDLKSKHRNLINLNFWSIGFLSEHLTMQIQNKKYEYFDEDTVNQLFFEAIDKGRLDINLLKPKLKNRLLDAKAQNSHS